MEFQKFWKERERMCKYHEGFCKQKCPLFSVRSIQYRHNCRLDCSDFPEEAEKIVEQWAKEHPVVTNGQKYQEIMGQTFGEAYPDGVLGLKTSGGEHGIQYTDDWWNAEYQPPKGEEE